MQRLLSTEEIAKYLNVGMDTMHKWVQNNQIPYIRLSFKCVRFEKEKIEKWLGEKRISSVKKPLSLVMGRKVG